MTLGGSLCPFLGLAGVWGAHYSLELSLLFQGERGGGDDTAFPVSSALEVLRHQA